MKKKKLIILGGNSNNNILWIHKMNKIYTKDYDVTSIYYDHWENNSSIDFDAELKKLEKIDNDIKDFYVVAKSVGSIISLIGIEKQVIKPKGIVILGLPLKYLQKNNINIDNAVNIAIKETKILVIQQKNDPIGSYQEVVKELPANIKVIEIPGNYHVYGNINHIKNLIDNFLNN